MTFVRQIDMRYVGQSHELPMGVGDAPLDAARIAGLVSAFHEEHRRAYGFSAPHEPAELVNLRVTAVGAIAKPQLSRISSDGAGRDAVKATRRVYFAETGGFIDCAVYDRYALGAGSTVHGPAIVEESDSTTVVHPGYDAVVNDFGHLLITKATVE
jgi:N-methylhydantoinase A